MHSEDAHDKQPRAIERRIKEVYESMPGSERALADRVLEYPSDVILCSATELANLAGASKAAVSRFVKRLGYSDFRDMQREIRHAQSTGDPLFLTAGRLHPTGAEGSLAAHLAQDAACLRQTIESIDEQAANAVARRIVEARRVVCLGFRNSYFFASYAKRQINYIRPNVSLIPEPGQMLMEEISDLGPTDLLLAVGLRRRPPILADVLKLMQEQNVPIAYVTDRRAVSTTKYATWSMPCQVRGTSLFDSCVGVVSLLNFICTRATEFAGLEGRNRMRRVEEMLDLLGELDPGN
jgi:DNA-binding MurR/RpiR family transcriptional regulator